MGDSKLYANCNVRPGLHVVLEVLGPWLILMPC